MSAQYYTLYIHVHVAVRIVTLFFYYNVIYQCLKLSLALSLTSLECSCHSDMAYIHISTI